MDGKYAKTSSARWLATASIAICLACSDRGDSPDPVRMQSALLEAAPDGGDGGADGGADPDMDAGVDPCPPFATDTSCNGVDNDCNGATDEDYVPQSTVCGSGACTAAGATSCVAGAVQDSCTPGTPAADDSTCDGVDDDCNGAVDEDHVAESTVCGTVVCTASGATACVDGAPGQCVPALSSDGCNGLDDDCDGDTDEDYVAQNTRCGVGACSASGATSCVAGAVQDSCSPGTPAQGDATCNGLDEDCDGDADEDYLAQSSSCGSGACAATGVVSCVGGAVQDSCIPGAPAAHDAICNGVDDDCDGSTDEDHPSQSTVCGTGACTSAGVTSCVSGAVQDSCIPGTPAGHDSSCDGLDDDCNGSTDEGFSPQVTTCGVGACAAIGATACVAGSVQNSCTPGMPAGGDASCDGLDDDCNGSTDEDYGSVCAGSEVTTCVMGSLAYAPCSDDDACNGDEGCANGSCTESAPPDPDDGNDCTVDACEPESGVVHAAAPLGTSCADGVCDGTECVTPRSCREWLRLAPGSADAVYRIDVDGPGPSEAFDVYCDMTTAGGGWQLMTVSQPNRVLIGTGYCQSPSPETACAGQLHPVQASARSEILVRDTANGAWLVYGGFSGGAQSALRYFTRELPLTMSSSCANGHVCDDIGRDPGLTVRQTSGFPLVHVTPLHQWWRFGGWWVGVSTAEAAHVHSSSYTSTSLTADLHTRIRSRTSLSLAVPAVLVGDGQQAIYHRDDGCADGLRDGIETDVDCGGTCAGCGPGQDCSGSGDCASGMCDNGECAAPARSCSAILTADPLASSGRYLIDVDGPGPTDAFSVYCDMVTDGGGWQLVSSARSDVAQVIFGDVFCTDPSPTQNCHGHMHPLQASASTAVMVLAPASGDYIVYDQFSGGASSALRYFTRELALSSSTSCTGTHVCADTSRDPALRVARTSGYPVVYEGPLVQWWLRGGWWVGANPNAGEPAGRIHHSGYNGSSDLRARASASESTVLQSADHQLLLFRNSAP